MVVIIGYDPVAGEIEMACEDGRPRLGVPAERLVVKCYNDLGSLYLDATPRHLEVGILPEDESLFFLNLVPVGHLRWRVELPSPTGAPTAPPQT